MAYLTLGKEFYEDNTKLYNEIIRRVNGEVINTINDIRLIYFESKEYRTHDYCIAYISSLRRSGNKYFKRIIKTLN